MYQQEFYLHAYTMILQQRPFFIESKEGFTYLPKEKEHQVSNLLLTFINPQERLKHNKKVSLIITSIKINPLDRMNAEFVDIDKLLDVYIDCFK